jgi:hypothetical protein
MYIARHAAFDAQSFRNNGRSAAGGSDCHCQFGSIMVVDAGMDQNKRKQAGPERGALDHLQLRYAMRAEALPRLCKPQ